MEPFLIVGLGNPGQRYQHTLHNVGYKVVDRLAEKRGWKFKNELKFLGQVAKGTYESQEFHLLKPETYMNLSGESVKLYLDYFNISQERLIVVVDDADLSLGQLRLKNFGGSGGHNGLKDIELKLNSSSFKRLRIGIGRPPVDIPMSLADYVLAQQSESVWKTLSEPIETATHLLERLAKENYEAVMKAANTTSNGCG